MQHYFEGPMEPLWNVCNGKGTASHALIMLAHWAERRLASQIQY